MDDNRNNALLTQQSTSLPMASLREQSTSTLQAAIRGNTHDATAEAEIMRMANVCLAQFYDPDLDAETKLGVRASFVRALSDKPIWAVSRAFDAWAKTMTRRPSPAEIVMLADRELKPLADELAWRDKAQRERAEASRKAQIVSAEAAARIMQEHGFTPKRMQDIAKAPMASTFAEAESIAEAPPPAHWSDTAAEDSAEMAALKAAREANPIIREAREQAARRQAVAR